MTVAFPRVVQLGSVGPDVTAHKRALIRWNKANAGVVVTGPPDILGGQADALLRRFQHEQALKSDGVLGPATYAKLVGLELYDAYGELLLEQARVEFLYLNPYRAVAHFRFSGYDQGVDVSGAGQVFAVGPGEVVVSTTTSGWPGGGAVSYRFTEGRANGLTVYLAENITPLVHVGQKVTAHVPVAVMRNAYPYTESGWAQDGTDNPMSQPISHVPTHFGVNFGQLLRSLGEHRLPAEQPQEGTPLPPGWPQWPAL